ncbi:hypothetical protein [Thiocapsa sp. UBA6158]|jgi:hypothetical protein|uniref:hypothetical protein n=1 Tax=Thiocapsa sp. UBA6158 TaxID=1947692 RepID=UPI0025F70EA3|nr:hypothetical protein [Thiocapsa sp. UBA6158]
MTDVENYRIEDKTRVNLRGKPATSFKMFERNGRAFVFAGNFFRPGGHDATDEQCIAFARFEGGAEDFDPLDLQD